jgi:hypothetical protein
VATPGPYAWKNVTILGGGFVSGIEFSSAPGCNGAIYARTDVGGAYRWDLAAQRWSPITDWVGRDESNLTGIESIAPDPVDPNLVYVAAGQYLTSGNGMVLRSTDMGATWPQQSAIPVPMGGNVDGRNMGERLAVDPNLTSILYFASRTAGLWKSTDSAASFGAVNTFPVKGTANYGLTFVFFDKRAATPGSATSTIYVGVTTSSTTSAGSVTTSTAPSLYRTIDGGSTWQAVPGQPPNMFPHHAAMDYATGSLYFAFNDAWGPNNVSAGAVWKLDTSNDKWTNVSPPTGKGGFGGISVDAVHPSTLVVTTIDRWPDEIYRTTNGGASWSAIGSQAPRNLAGAQWLLWHTNSPTTTGWMGDIAIDPHDPQRVLYETGQGIWWSEDLTAADRGAYPSWTFRDQGLEETVATGLISPNDPNGGAHLLSAVGDIAGFRHDDLSASPPDGMFSAPIFGTTTGIDFAELKPSLVVRVGTTGTNNRTSHGAYSTDGGSSWSAFAAEPAGVTSGSIAICADGSTFVWAPARTATAVYSRDHGATWTASSGLPSGARVASDRLNPNKFYATNRSLFYVSMDGGASFAQSPATGLSQGAGQPRPVFGIEGDVWVTAGNGLYRSTDSGTSFAAIPAIQSAGAVGFGMGAAASTYPAIYMAGRANGVSGIYRSDDGGSSWQRIDDAQHQFGFIGYITGDPRIVGRVYLGSGGRGILYGDPM